ncbi:MAG: hypothetical protein LBE82_02605, partial [Chitinophagaceae bacterium]|nr:hypothetical protein [Chitinophagaceae bacterium]
MKRIFCLLLIIAIIIGSCTSKKGASSGLNAESKMPDAQSATQKVGNAKPNAQSITQSVQSTKHNTQSATQKVQSITQKVENTKPNAQSITQKAKSQAYSALTGVYTAPQQEGVIGLMDGKNFDNPADNIFKINIKETPRPTDKVWLE